MEQKIKRRSLLGGLGVAAAALVAVKVAGGTKKTSEATNVIAASDPEGDGYRLTEHVKKYYRTTTI
jgi:hypothetical protein